MANQDEIQLIQQCGTVKQVIGDGIQWVSTNADEEKQYVTIQNLKRFRRMANRYEKAAPKRPSIAIFGQSQVGKSYLVSNLTKTPDDFSLMVISPDTGKEIDFITEINPPGGGKEATGLVSRFTIETHWNAGQQPFVLRLFSQADVAKIIINGYLSDITYYEYKIDRQAIQQVFQNLAKRKNAMMLPGMSDDEVYDIKEYLENKFRDHFIIKDLANLNFWDDVSNILPYLDSEDRWEIFEILWGKQPFFTELFKKLSTGLKQLNFLPEVRCNLNALTPQTDTILDVERLRELYKSSNKPPVDLYSDTGKLATLNRSIISALTAEAILPLPARTANHPKRTFMQYSDVLDFPGARSRQQIPEITFEGKSSDDKLLVFLRGKVAFLFDRYNLNYEISTLLFCMDDKQPEVADLPKFLYEWIKNTHGGSPEKREERERNLATLVPQNDIKRLIPLLVVFTKFNIELAGNPATEKVGELGPHNAKWTARFSANFADQMGISVGDQWIQKWNNEGSFKNLFLLRDLKWSKSVYDGFIETGKETNVKVDYSEKLKDMQKSFSTHAGVQKHFHNPAEAWSEATELNKSGMDYIIRYLTPTCNPIIKREQIRSQIAELKNGLRQELQQFYRGGSINEKLAKARMNAMQVFITLTAMQKNNNTFGNFVDQMVIRDDIAWKVYYDLMMYNQVANTQAVVSQGSGRKTIPLNLINMLKSFISIDENDNANAIIEKLKVFFGVNDDDALKTFLSEAGIDIAALLEAAKGSGNLDMQDLAYIFASRLLARWLEHIQRLKKDEVLDSLGLKKEIASLILSELDKNKTRVNLMCFIADATREHIKNFTITSNIDVVARISANIINKFVDTVGYAFLEEEKRPKRGNSTLPIFTDGEIKAPKKNEIKLGIVFPGEGLFADWLVGIKDSFVQNVYAEEKVKDQKSALADAELGKIIEKVN